MSYQLVDEAGNGRDFATNLGIMELDQKAGPELTKLLETGEADQALCQAIIAECAEDETMGYIADLLEDSTPPVTLTQGECVD